MSGINHYHNGNNYADYSPPEASYYDEIPSQPPTYVDFDEYGSLWSKVAALLWIATLVFWLYVHSKHEEERERRSEEQRTEELHQAKRKSMLQPDRRRIVISETITSRIMKDEDLKGLDATTASTTSTGTMNTTSETSESHNADVENGEGANNGEDDIGSMHNTPPSECSICLERFEPGEQVSWSKELKCHHIFHTDCLQPWLMTNDDCPCCRTLFFDEFDFVKRGLISQKGKLSKLPDSFPSDDGNDNNNGLDGSARFRIVNGLVSIVRNVRDGLSGSESNRGDFSSTTTTSSSATHTVIETADHDDLAESQPPRSKNDSNDETISLEMVSMVTKTKSDTACINNHNDQEQQHGRSHNKKKRRKGRGKQRYSALSNDSDDSDDNVDNQDIGDSSEIEADNHNEGVNDNEEVESDDIV